MPTQPQQPSRDPPRTAAPTEDQGDGDDHRERGDDPEQEGRREAHGDQAAGPDSNPAPTPTPRERAGGGRAAELNGVMVPASDAVRTRVAGRRAVDRQPGQGDVPRHRLHQGGGDQLLLPDRRRAAPLHRRPGAHPGAVPRRRGRAQLLREERPRRYAELGAHRADPDQRRTGGVRGRRRAGHRGLAGQPGRPGAARPPVAGRGARPPDGARPGALERGEPLADRVVVDLDPGAGTTIVERRPGGA